jgi:CheY-like chemotaxis protein
MAIEPPEIIFLDLNMPNMDGFRVFRKVSGITRRNAREGANCGINQFQQPEGPRPGIPIQERYPVCHQTD